MTTTDIADIVTKQRIAVNAGGFRDDADLSFPELADIAGRAIVILKIANILTPDNLDDPDELDLTIEAAIKLARKLLMAACQAMNHDPGPWLITRTDMAVLEAAVAAHNTDAEEETR